MIRVLGFGLVVLGSVASALPVHADEEIDLTVYRSDITPDRLYRGSGVRPIADTAHPPSEKAAPTEEEIDSNPVSAGCQSGNCSSGSGWTRPRPDYPPRPCWVNDQYEPEWYIAPMIGIQDQGEKAINLQGNSFRADPQGGPQGGVAFGWATGPTWLGRNRVELELAARTNDVDTFRINNVNFPVDAELTLLSAMANYLWDFKHPDRDWYPYVGAGLGVARVEFDSDNLLAFQAIAGVSYRLRSYLEVFAEARYFGTSEGDFTVTTPGFTTPGGLVIPAGERKVTADFESGGIMLGARIMLGKRRCVDGIPAADGRATRGSSGWRYRGF
ncbi:MAG: outer membrane beta-barrel protein [Planctomycetaceae bacterium]|nr:outer membrane beta-barrel protein [Planctomycetaceae bacterium]